jgi:dihydroorotate dehydrogenase
MGFNNPGALDASRIVAAQERFIPRGINIGKSKVTPIERAVEDYLESLSFLNSYADYIALNVSSPNTPGLRSLQNKKSLNILLSSIQKELSAISKKEGRRIPLFVKLAPDLSEREFKETLETAMKCHIGGVILTNTTIDHSSIPERSRTEGGLSGRPLRDRSTEMIRWARHICGRSLSIIGVGGIFSGADAIEKIRAGADLVQIYTGYIYEGPGLPAAICRDMDAYLEREGATLGEIVGGD